MSFTGKEGFWEIQRATQAKWKMSQSKRPKRVSTCETNSTPPLVSSFCGPHKWMLSIVEKCVWGHVCVFATVQRCAHTYVKLFVRARVCARTCEYTCMWVCTCVCVSGGVFWKHLPTSGYVSSEELWVWVWGECERMHTCEHVWGCVLSVHTCMWTLSPSRLRAPQQHTLLFSLSPLYRLKGSVDDEIGDKNWQ
jgi:hypothetical protein